MGRSGPRPTPRAPEPGPAAGRAPLRPSPRAPRSLTQRQADHESQQGPHDGAAPLSRAPGVNSGARSGGARRPVECPRERAGAAAAALEPARWGKEGGRGPPAPVTAGGPAPGPGVRASPPRGWLLLVGLPRWRAQPGASARCPDPGRFRLGRWGAGPAFLRTAAAAAAGEGGGRGRGWDESPRGGGEAEGGRPAAKLLPQRPGRRPLHPPLWMAQGPRLLGKGARSGCPGPPEAGNPQRQSLGKVTLRITRGLRGQFGDRA